MLENMNTLYQLILVCLWIIIIFSHYEPDIYNDTQEQYGT